MEIYSTTMVNIFNLLQVESPKMFHIKTRSSNELKHKVHSLLASYSAEVSLLDIFKVINFPVQTEDSVNFLFTDRDIG